MDDGVSECRHFLLMGNHQYRNAIGAIEVREQFHDLYGSFGVEIACGFVRKQHVGIGDNSPRDGDALLLAAGQFGGCMIPPILQTYFFQRRHAGSLRSEEHTSELQSLMRTSYAFFCLKKTNYTTTTRYPYSYTL